jgi:hypothetical protein
MKFFFPDSDDTVYRDFDFDRERRPVFYDNGGLQYAWEVFAPEPVCDGLLISKGLIHPREGAGSKYTFPQRKRLRLVGAHEFFKLNAGMKVIGDCGAFTYVKEREPAETVDDVIEFYEDCGVDFGISVDHVILPYQPKWDDEPGATNPELEECERRMKITIDNASEFFQKHRAKKNTFYPIGAAQGWSAGSYARCVQELQRIGYDYIALGGMVPLRTNEVISCLQRIDAIRGRETKIHLLGITRLEAVREFEKYGVVSLDSTSPLLKAFKDDTDNYFDGNQTFTAIRVPQVEGNPSLRRKIAAGQLSQESARKLERTALASMRLYAERETSLESVLESVINYERFCGNKRDNSSAYERTLSERPWERCPCDVCRQIGYHVILFRGAERNRRRGFHNVWAFYRQLKQSFTPKSSMFELNGSI